MPRGGEPRLPRLVTLVSVDIVTGLRRADIELFAVAEFAEFASLGRMRADNERERSI